MEHVQNAVPRVKAYKTGVRKQPISVLSGGGGWKVQLSTRKPHPVPRQRASSVGVENIKGKVQSPVRHVRVWHRGKPSKNPKLLVKISGVACRHH